jgi:putative glutamine amidotransferase
MKVVAVSQRVDVWPERNECRDALDQQLILFIASCGGLAVPVPNFVEKPDLLRQWLDTLQPKAIILSGGNDIGQCNERYMTECKLLEYAERCQLPVLGICRGMQMMGVWAGAQLKAVTGHVRSRHHIVGDIRGEVNSFHNFSLIDMPDDYAVLAKSEDGEIEAICHQLLPWEGWMWHPERESEFSKEDIQRFVKLIDG